MARRRKAPAPPPEPVFAGIPEAVPGEPADTTVEIIAPNAWSSRGKHYQGDTPTIPTPDAKALIARGQAKEI